MTSTFRLGRILGVRVGVNWSVLVVAWLLAWSLASTTLPDAAPGHSEAGYWIAGTLTAVVFLAAEGATLGMVIKTQRDIDRAEAAGDLATVEDKKRTREDWLVYMGINHVASALEAYVSAHLWDFPGELQLRAAPGGFAATASVPVRFR